MTIATTNPTSFTIPTRTAGTVVIVVAYKPERARQTVRTTTAAAAVRVTTRIPSSRIPFSSLLLLLMNKSTRTTLAKTGTILVQQNKQETQRLQRNQPQKEVSILQVTPYSSTLSLSCLSFQHVSVPHLMHLRKYQDKSGWKTITEGDNSFRKLHDSRECLTIQLSSPQQLWSQRQLPGDYQYSYDNSDSDNLRSTTTSRLLCKPPLSPPPFELFNRNSHYYFLQNDGTFINNNDDLNGLSMPNMLWATWTDQWNCFWASFTDAATNTLKAAIPMIESNDFLHWNHPLGDENSRFSQQSRSSSPSFYFDIENYDFRWIQKRDNKIVSAASNIITQRRQRLQESLDRASFILHEMSTNNNALISNTNQESINDGIKELGRDLKSYDFDGKLYVPHNEDTIEHFDRSRYQPYSSSFPWNDFDLESPKVVKTKTTINNRPTALSGARREFDSGKKQLIFPRNQPNPMNHSNRNDNHNEQVFNQSNSNEICTATTKKAPSLTLSSPWFGFNSLRENSGGFVLGSFSMVVALMTVSMALTTSVSQQNLDDTTTSLLSDNSNIITTYATVAATTNAAASNFFFTLTSTANVIVEIMKMMLFAVGGVLSIAIVSDTFSNNTTVDVDTFWPGTGKNSTYVSGPGPMKRWVERNSPSHVVQQNLQQLASESTIENTIPDGGLRMKNVDDENGLTFVWQWGETILKKIRDQFESFPSTTNSSIRDTHNSNDLNRNFQKHTQALGDWLMMSNNTVSKLVQYHSDWILQQDFMKNRVEQKQQQIIAEQGLTKIITNSVTEPMTAAVATVLAIDETVENQVQDDRSSIYRDQQHHQQQILKLSNVLQSTAIDNEKILVESNGSVMTPKKKLTLTTTLEDRMELQQILLQYMRQQNAQQQANRVVTYMTQQSNRMVSQIATKLLASGASHYWNVMESFLVSRWNNVKYDLNNSNHHIRTGLFGLCRSTMNSKELSKTLVQSSLSSSSSSPSKKGFVIRHPNRKLQPMILKEMTSFPKQKKLNNFNVIQKYDAQEIIPCDSTTTTTTTTTIKGKLQDIVAMETVWNNHNGWKLFSNHNQQLHSTIKTNQEPLTRVSQKYNKTQQLAAFLLLWHFKTSIGMILRRCLIPYIYLRRMFQGKIMKDVIKPSIT